MLCGFREFYRGRFENPMTHAAKGLPVGDGTMPTTRLHCVDALAAKEVWSDGLRLVMHRQEGMTA